MRHGEPERKKVGEYLRAARVASQLSQRAAGIAAGPSLGFTLLSRIENGQRFPSAEQIQALARVYRIDQLFALAQAGYISLPEFDKLTNYDSSVDGTLSARDLVDELLAESDEDDLLDVAAFIAALRISRSRKSG
jgi:transcriptional regulator with XRE-family HTH domain